MKTRNKVFIGVFGIILIGFVFPERKVIPVLGATSQDWNAKTFWYEPWGSSGVHKGIDIFASAGTPVVASTDLVIVYRGAIQKGGNVVVGLGPKWRLHYFAHLDLIDFESGRFVRAGNRLGGVGTSGNANGKQPHLHFSIVSIIPFVWLVDLSTQGYKKMFYLDPGLYFSGVNT